jgi:hypothetical protein
VAVADMIGSASAHSQNRGGAAQIASSGVGTSGTRSASAPRVYRFSKAAAVGERLGAAGELGTLRHPTNVVSSCASRRR